MNLLATPDLGENYGTCAVHPCLCLRGPWRGRACPNWQPTSARTYEELSAWQAEQRSERKDK